MVHTNLTGFTRTVGQRSDRKRFRPGKRIAQLMPMTQTRKVDAGIDGSSKFATAQRTSK